MEIWKDILGYEGIYQVSTFGKVKALLRQKGKGTGRGSYISKERILKSRINRSGYKQVSLYKSGTARTLLVHRLIMIAFVPNLESKPEVNHIDGIKLNNDLSNLEWATHSENAKHAFKMGLRIPPVFDRKGSSNGSSKLIEKDIVDIVNMSKAGFSTKEIMAKFGISQPNASRILRRVSWTHVKIA